MTPTHVLIPIKDVDKIIKSNESSMKIFHDRDDFDGYNSSSAIVSTLQSLKKKGKQISLDEKDIEEKLNKLYPKGSPYGWSGKRIGYKQALKDIRDEK